MKIRNILILVTVVSLVFVPNANAARYIIQFGGSFGLNYVPNSLSVHVGDTVRWQGDFSMHPLSSTGVPVGALEFSQSSNDVFDYVVMVPGTYTYQCDFHSGLGMTGQFDASSTAGVKDANTSNLPDAFKLRQNFPNPFNPATTFSFDIPSMTHVSLKIYNLIGEEVATIVNENMSPGSYSKVWNAASMPSGVYFYKLQAGQFTGTRKLVLLK
jgi:plastocyanin